jgi:hypothetical protein
MTEKLYEKYQQPKTRFYADWSWRLLCLLGVAFVSYATLWGDDRYVKKDELDYQVTRSVEKVLNKIEHRLASVEAHAIDARLHPTSADWDERYVTRREFNLILTTLKRIEDKLQ